MTKTCPVCGKEFETSRGARKFCSDECFRQYRREYDKLQKRKTYEKKLEVQSAAPVSSSVDKRLRSCHAAGQTYAQAQRAETIEKFARVEVPEAFQVIATETGRKVMFFSKEEREALIRIEAQVEVLQEYFKTVDDGIDYPGIVLGRILEQVKGLMGEADA